MISSHNSGKHLKIHSRIFMKLRISISKKDHIIHRTQIPLEKPKGATKNQVVTFNIITIQF